MATQLISSDDSLIAENFETYRAVIQIRDKVIGGRPNDPNAIRGWIAQSLFPGDKAQLFQQHLMELLVKSGVPVTPNMTIAELEAAAEALAEEKNKNVFFRADDGELVIEGRQIKAMLKEAVAIFYAYSGRTAAAFGKDVNPYGKNAKSWLAERVFVAETLVGLGVKEPSGTFLFVGHTSGPQGQVSSMTNLEYVDQPTLTFHIGVLKGLIKPQHWREVWAECELLGLGAKRSQSWGQFKVMDFSQLDEEEAKPIWKNVYFGPFNRRVSPSAPITIEWPEPPAAPEPVDVVDGAVDGAVVVQAVD